MSPNHFSIWALRPPFPSHVGHSLLTSTSSKSCSAKPSTFPWRCMAIAWPISLSMVSLSNWSWAQAFIFAHQSLKVVCVPSHVPGSRRRDVLKMDMIGGGLEDVRVQEVGKAQYWGLQTYSTERPTHVPLDAGGAAMAALSPVGQ